MEKAMKKLVKKIVDSELYEWPPQCATFYYQPLRPCKNIAVEMSDMSKKPTSNSQKL